MPQRSSDVVEIYSERSLAAGIGGLVALAGAVLFFIYGGEAMKGLAIVLLIAAVAAIGYAGFQAMQIKKVASFGVKCVYCNYVNKLTEAPTSDVTCRECHRLIPIVNGVPINVQQVRCGFCNELNYYSAKTEVLLCEYCNHDIPISREDGAPSRQSAFAVQQDDNLYELILTGQGNKPEELIDALQHMLALNRNQVKDILNNLPAVLLSGLPRKKAEMLRAQIEVHNGSAEFKPVQIT